MLADSPPLVSEKPEISRSQERQVRLAWGRLERPDYLIAIQHFEEKSSKAGVQNPRPDLYLTFNSGTNTGKGKRKEKEVVTTSRTSFAKLTRTVPKERTNPHGSNEIGHSAGACLAGRIKKKRGRHTTGRPHPAAEQTCH